LQWAHEAPPKIDFLFPLTNSLPEFDPQRFHLEVMNLQTFSLFPRLPFEIRWAIWYLAMTPRVVNITPLLNPHEHPRQQENPSLLRVCHESRTVALERYELSADIDKTYINFTIDTIYMNFDIDNFAGSSLAPSKNDASFKLFAIDIEWIQFVGPKRFMEKLNRCQGLRELTILVNFNQMIKKECEAKLSVTLEKYENMEDARLFDLAGYWDDDSVTFIEILEAISIIWVWGARKHSIDKDRWPDISVVAQPPAGNSADLLRSSLARGVHG
jgi:Fe-S-cluster formation regulator IscX/YfhJ